MTVHVKIIKGRRGYNVSIGDVYERIINKTD